MGGGLGFCETSFNPIMAGIVDERFPASLGTAFALTDMAFSIGFVAG